MNILVSKMTGALRSGTLRSGGTAEAWGSNASGQFGTGDGLDYPSRHLIPSLTGGHHI